MYVHTLYIVPSVVDRHRVDAEPDPNFDVDADQDPDSGSGFVSHAIHSYPKFLHMLKNKEKFRTFIHNNVSLQSFSFLINGKGVILDSKLKFYGKK
jgi:hypothetical protein